MPNLSEPRRRDDGVEDLYMKVPDNVDGINDFDKDGNTPLHNAIIAGCYILGLLNLY